MPLMKVNGTLVLRCVNHDSGHDEPSADVTTMTQMQDAAGLGTIYPNGTKGNTTVPANVYACAVCGYIELYAARIVDPARWPRSRE
jgi:hypothetical protein